MLTLVLNALGAAKAFTQTGLAKVLFGAALAAVFILPTGFMGYARMVSRHQAEVAALKLDQARERVEISGATVKGYEQALALVEDQQRLLSEQATNVRLAIDEIPAALAKERASLRSTFQEITRDPKYDCRRLPLPDALLERLRRPGAASVPAAPVGEGSSIPTAPVGVSRDTSP